MRQTKNRVALVTGASRGIGRGIALALGREGFDLLINYVSNRGAAEECAQACADAAREAGHEVRAVLGQADVSSGADREGLIDLARREFGRLDLLVNNAGVSVKVRADLLETSEESFDRLMAINLKGPFFLTQLAAHWMIEQVQAGQLETPPRIVIISSISAYAASINRAEYCIAKAGLAMVTPLFAARLAEHGINVYEIRPGIIATDMTGPVKEKYDRLIGEGLTPIRRWGEAEDVGRAVAAIGRNLLPFSTGEVLNVDGGFHLRQL